MKVDRIKNDKGSNNYLIGTVSRALELLELFQDGDGELGITELSRRMNIHKNNVFRLLFTLKSKNYVEQDEATGKYRLGLKNLELGQAIIRQMGLLRQSLPVLRALKEECRESCYVSVLKGWETYFLAGVDSELPLQVASRTGSRLPVHCTAAGKAQIAHFELEDLIRQLRSRRLARYTPRTIIDPIELQQELQGIMSRGYAVEDEELDMGVRSIAAPLFDYNRQIVGALSIAGPTSRLTDTLIETDLAPRLMRAARELSSRLGYQ